MGDWRKIDDSVYPQFLCPHSSACPNLRVSMALSSDRWRRKHMMRATSSPSFLRASEAADKMPGRKVEKGTSRSRWVCWRLEVGG